MWLACGTALTRERREHLLDVVRGVLATTPAQVQAGATCPNPNMLVLRAVAPLVEPLMALFQQTWAQLRPAAWGLANTPPRIWNTMYQCRPVHDNDGVLKESWFKHWDDLPPDNMVRRRWVSFDTANSANSRSDYTVGTAWIETFDKRYFLVDVVRARVEFAELVKLIDEFARRTKASSILIEDAGAGKSLLQAYQGKLAAPLIAINPYNKSKEFRFDEISPMFETGAVLLPRRHELLPDIERELLEFPNGTKDDIVDSCTHALRWARGSTVKRGTKKLGGVY
jgi:predicted phage terminase large subunit-like protein